MDEVIQDLIRIITEGPRPLGFTLLLMHSENRPLIVKVLDSLPSPIENDFQSWIESFDPDTVCDPQGLFDSQAHIGICISTTLSLLKDRAKGRFVP